MPKRTGNDDSSTSQSQLDRIHRDLAECDGALRRVRATWLASTRPGPKRDEGLLRLDLASFSVGATRQLLAQPELLELFRAANNRHRPD